MSLSTEVEFSHKDFMGKLDEDKFQMSAEMGWDVKGGKEIHTSK